jgi:transposase
VSVKETSVCVVDAAGRVVLEQKVPTEPADIIALLTSLGVSFCRIGIEAGPLSQWLVNALTAADLPVICVETRHMKALLTAQQINKTDRNDACGIAQMMRVGLFKPVHVKTLVAQEQRMLLTSRKLLDLELELRGTLRNFGLNDAAGRQQLLHHAPPEREAEIYLHAMADDLGRQPIPTQRVRADVLIPPDYSSRAVGESAASPPS